MLVFVDAGPTMTATPGDGVGVFVEYKSGGHWRIWWTCDSNRTAQGCAFVVSASVAPGGVSNVVGEGAVNVTTSQASLSASSTTWYDITGVDFDTTPGATVTLTADVGGLRDQAFLFFIQQGQVRGGFTGKLTNPLMLQGASL